MTEPAPRPLLSYSVGIVGHRADRLENVRAIRARVAEVLETADSAITRESAEGLYPEGRQPLRLLSALAEGADRIAAQIALERGAELDVVLPFTAEEYRKDFADDASRAEFDALLQQASRVLVLDGKADDRTRAYEAAGLVMLGNCDLLLAVWDGGPGRGRGGTREVIGEAARRSIPIVIVDPAGVGATLRSAATSGPMRLDDLPERPLADLPDLIAREVGLEGGVDRAEDWFAAAQPPPRPPIYSAYPWLLTLAGVGPKRRRAAEAPAPAPDPATLPGAFAWWDAAANQAAQSFRSAVIVNFSLAALAVVLAATSLLAGEFKWLFVAAEVATILLLLVNALAARRLRWQDRWLEAREVAELLRVCALLRHVGVGRGIADPARGGLLGWYAGAYARSAAMAGADLSAPVAAAAPLVAEVRGQADWNAATARRMSLAAHRIKLFGEALFAVVLVAALGWLALNLVAPETADGLRYPLTTITAGLPAIATASYGIRIILDFDGIAQRTGRIGAGLDDLLARWAEGPGTAAALQVFARRAADIMLGDLAAWRLLTEGRRLTIPG